MSIILSNRCMGMGKHDKEINKIIEELVEDGVLKVGYVKL